MIHSFTRLARSTILAAMRLMTGLRVNHQAPLPKTPCVFYANHRSNGDAILVMCGLPGWALDKARPVAARDYWASSPLKLWLGQEVCRGLLIDRIRPARDAVVPPGTEMETQQVANGSCVASEPSPIDQMADACAEGQSLIIFPEGTRNQTEQDLLEFKSGIYRVALRQPDLHFIPVWIDNLNRVLPKGKLLPIPLICSVNFGTPIRLQEGETKEAFLQRARSELLLARPGSKTEGEKQ